MPSWPSRAAREALLSSNSVGSPSSRLSPWRGSSAGQPAKYSPTAEVCSRPGEPPDDPDDDCDARDEEPGEREHHRGSSRPLTGISSGWECRDYLILQADGY